MTMIPAPWGHDAYAAQQLLEMQHCERCPYERVCPVYGEPHGDECQSLQDWRNTR